MDRGKVVERGKHPDLLAPGGLYAHLYETQINRAVKLVEPSLSLVDAFREK